MTTAADAIGWLNARLGKRDDGGRFIWSDLIARHIFPAWYSGMAWCGATQLDLCEQLGVSIAPFKPADVIYCPSVVRVAKAHGLWRPSKQSATGDWALMRWDGNMQTDEANHIVMVLKNDPASEYLTVIGGNHGDGKTTGQRGIFVRTWPRSVVLGTVNRQSAYSAPVAPHAVAQAAGVLLKGSKNAQVAALQAGLNRVAHAGLAVDTDFGPATDAAVRAFQKANGLVADGIVGPMTKAALAKAGVAL